MCYLELYKQHRCNVQCAQYTTLGTRKYPVLPKKVRKTKIIFHHFQTLFIPRSLGLNKWLYGIFQVLGNVWQYLFSDTRGHCPLPKTRRRRGIRHYFNIFCMMNNFEEIDSTDVSCFGDQILHRRRLKKKNMNREDYQSCSAIIIIIIIIWFYFYVKWFYSKWVNTQCSGGCSEMSRRPTCVSASVWACTDALQLPMNLRLTVSYCHGGIYLWQGTAVNEGFQNV